MSQQAKATVQADNEAVKITEWRFAPGEATGWHRHGYDYVVVPMTTGPLRIKSAQTEVSNDITPGQAGGADRCRCSGNLRRRSDEHTDLVGLDSIGRD